MALLIFYLLVALLFSFLCSIMEAAILSTTPSFINTKLNEGKEYAKSLKKYKDNIDRPLAAILTLNTFAHTIGAAGVGAQAQIIWGNQYLSITSAVLTILILFFSEIIPKTLGANYWMHLAKPTVIILITGPCSSDSCSSVIISVAFSDLISNFTCSGSGSRVTI